jgi:hypothetical protein
VAGVDVNGKAAEARPVPVLNRTWAKQHRNFTVIAKDEFALDPASQLQQLAVLRQLSRHSLPRISEYGIRRSLDAAATYGSLSLPPDF